jgi:DNA gyrase subunit A
MCITQGWIKKTPLAAFVKLSARGLIIISLDEDDQLKWVNRCTPRGKPIYA